MLNTIYMDAVVLLDGGWKPEDRDEIKEEFGLTDDEANDICAEMENVLSRWTEDDEADLRYHEARDNGELNWK